MTAFRAAVWMIVGVLLTHTLSAINTENQAVMLVARSIAQVFGVGFVLYFFSREDLKLNLRRPSLAIVVSMFAFGVALTFPLALMHEWLLTIWPMSPEQADSMAKMTNFTNVAHGLAFFVSVVVVAPLSEEALFRGPGFELLKEKSGAVGAVLISSLIFALGHIHPAFVGYALIAGLLFGALRLRYSVLATSAAHVGFNLSGFVLLFAS